MIDNNALVARAMHLVSPLADKKHPAENFTINFAAYNQEDANNLAGLICYASYIARHGRQPSGIEVPMILEEALFRFDPSEGRASLLLIPDMQDPTSPSVAAEKVLAALGSMLGETYPFAIATNTIVGQTREGPGVTNGAATFYRETSRFMPAHPAPKPTVTDSAGVLPKERTQVVANDQAAPQGPDPKRSRRKFLENASTLVPSAPSANTTYTLHYKDHPQHLDLSGFYAGLRHLQATPPHDDIRHEAAMLLSHAIPTFADALNLRNPVHQVLAKMLLSAENIGATAHALGLGKTFGSDKPHSNGNGDVAHHHNGHTSHRRRTEIKQNCKFLRENGEAREFLADQNAKIPGLVLLLQGALLEQDACQEASARLLKFILSGTQSPPSVEKLVAGSGTLFRDAFVTLVQQQCGQLVLR